MVSLGTDVPVPLLVYSLVEGLLGWFQFGAIINKAAINIHVHVLVQT